MNNRLWILPAFFLICCLSACVTERIEDPDSGEAYLDREIDKVVQRIPYETGKALFRDLNKLIAFGSFAIEPMCECLRHPNAKVRCSGAYVLGQLQAEGVVNDLLALMDDENKLVRLEAARAVLEIGAWDTVPVLLEGMNDPEENIRILSFQALKKKIGVDFGYKIRGTAEERQESLNKWNAWWANAKGSEIMEGSISSG